MADIPRNTVPPPAPDLVRGFRPLGVSAQGGRPDAMQLQYHRDHVYVGHLFSGGFSVLDVSDPRDMRAVGFHAAPPRTWNIHLQAADDLLLVIHARDLWKTLGTESNYYSIATLPTPGDVDYAQMGGHFGPHNLHENRPGTFVSDRMIFATYQNAGVRVFDIADPYRPTEIAALVPPAPQRMVDPRPLRPRVVQTADVTVTSDGIVFCTDYNAGLYAAELTA
jgi:hypothetical protein